MNSKENLKKSIIYNNYQIIITKSNIFQNDKLDFDKIIYGFNFTNTQSNIDYNLTNTQINTIKKLVDLGINFDMKNLPDKKISISSSDILFPICCVGKNRSQYLFYYFANLLNTNPQLFNLCYPASGDELSTIIKSKSNSVLGGFTIQYKSDGFSQAIKSSFGNEYSRSFHVFDKLIRKPESYLPTELKNLEDFKYKNTLIDIYDKDSDQVKDLYLNYYLNPDKLNELLENNHRINYICASPESFINLLEVLMYVSESNKSIDWKNVRIIYFGFNDIFQRSSVNQIELNTLNQKLLNTFEFN